MGSSIALPLDDFQQTSDGLVFVLQGLGGTDVSGENAVTELGGEGVQGIMDGVHIDAGQHVLERLPGGDDVGIVGWLLVGSEDDGQEHQRHQEYLEQAETQHGGNLEQCRKSRLRMVRCWNNGGRNGGW